MKKSEADKTDNKQYLTPPEVAIFLGVGHPKVIRFIETGELPAVDLSSEQGTGKRPRYRISRAALDAFLLRRSAKPLPAATRRTKLPVDDGTPNYY